MKVEIKFERLARQFIDALQVAKRHQQSLGCKKCYSIKLINKALKKAKEQGYRL